MILVLNMTNWGTVLLYLAFAVAGVEVVIDEAGGLEVCVADG